MVEIMKPSQIFGAVIAIMMLLAVTAAPAMAAQAESCGTQQPISKEENDRIVKIILGSDGFEKGAKKLKERGVDIDWSNPVLTKTAESYILAVYTKDASFSKKKGIIALYDGTEIKNIFLMESREVTNGAAIRLDSTINDEATELLFIKGVDGKVKIHMKDLRSGEVTTLDLTCEEICAAAMGIGCAVGSAIACAAICYGTAGFGCPTACSLIYYFMCALAMSSCDDICALI